ncbi:Beta-lactamase domain protein [Candidatus Saccharimonas aalborgensis]|uniref:Beta-lactamase domain protein n=1 Tax=Candidatus Saccharimonas aalborgensis TaxID=1332188 RepID=R4PN33_9BACT|nr:ribonuclease J [Candidatus Saccharimonas aalborgensis]MBP7775218.1 ribonuclease J [Candidatus Saccharimonas sp.]QQR51092.1 MAG: ribonuclease J [Candidatus Saccharibacteria bacterium]AGL62339.1 Beta-lactamase domain protein [Candidatus Saccharimonas aalborgensis]QQS68838.1 MAG: ribonuclease J [Candidatus Saccharibacteria bacterium]QQS71124.1 MAG: ribonuclease J [Candidatus Saccharibacteria bacterium]
MGQRRLSKPQADDASKRPMVAKQKSNNTVLNATTTRKGEVFRAQRRTSDNVNMQASQHMINVPVNKSIYNGYGGKQFSLVDQPKRPRAPRPTLKIIPIGGVGEMGIGKNMTAIEFDNDIIIIDMGFLFPGADYPGINYITPDITWLEENKHRIRGHVFTHGHLDHIGAFRHLVPKIPAPVYASKFTLGMLQRTMEETDGAYTPDYRELNPEAHDIVQICDSFSIELVRVNHSIPDATAVVVRTPVGNILSSGDWRIEENPVDGKKFDLPRLSEIQQKEGFLVFLNESTNCESDGTHTHGEFDIQHSMGEVMEKWPNSRVIISSFSSQLHRMQMILEEAQRHGRKVAFAGYSMIQNLEVALRTGAIKVPKDTVVKMEDIIKLPDGKVTIVCTGSQGEFSAVLNRMATGAHKYIKIKNSDVVVFSSNPIPGNEKYVVRTVDGLMREGGEIIQNGKTHLTGVGPLHLSGHGYYDDHVRVIQVVNPTYYIPNHGEFHMLVHNAHLAEKECGIPRENIFVCDAGDVVEFDHEGARKIGRVPVGGVMYDDAGEVVSEVVLKDRIHMSQEGMFVVVLTVQRGTGRLLTSPDIISRGFIYLRDSEELMGMIRAYLKQKAARAFAGRYDLDVIKKEIKDEVTHILYDQTRRTPIVIPVVNEIGVVSKNQPQPQVNSGQRPVQASRAPLLRPARRPFPPKQHPDSEVTEPHIRVGGHSY